ncbi:MAG: hypothetical protein LBF61_00810 [Azoarcus sp.]|jgi:hypothetical protein|nr:hypothetical protein [Azoarcus sp.]
MSETDQNETGAQRLVIEAVDKMYAGLAARIADIRADVRALEISQRANMDNVERRLGDRIDGLEKSIGHRVDGLESRIGRLEDEDKRILRENVKAGGLSGGVVGALVTGGIEIVKAIAGKV